MDDDKSDHDPLRDSRFKLNLGLTLKKAGDDSGKISINFGLFHLSHVDRLSLPSRGYGCLGNFHLVRKLERMIRRRPAVAWWRKEGSESPDRPGEVL